MTASWAQMVIMEREVKAFERKLEGVGQVVSMGLGGSVNNQLRQKTL